MKISEDVHNFYENLLASYFLNNQFKEKYNDEFLADLSCMVLNQLPPRYIRHQVDLVFYMSQQERVKMEKMVNDAVDKALALIKTDKYKVEMK